MTQNFYADTNLFKTLSDEAYKDIFKSLFYAQTLWPFGCNEASDFRTFSKNDLKKEF